MCSVALQGADSHREKTLSELQVALSMSDPEHENAYAALTNSLGRIADLDVLHDFMEGAVLWLVGALHVYVWPDMRGLIVSYEPQRTDNAHKLVTNIWDCIVTRLSQ